MNINDIKSFSAQFYANHYITSTTNGVSTPVNWDTPIWNNQFTWSSTNRSRIYFNKGGKYKISVLIPWPANGVGYRYIWVRKNGSTNMYITDSVLPISTDTVTNNLVFPIILNDNDYLEIMAYQNAGTLSIGGESSEKAFILIEALV